MAAPGHEVSAQLTVGCVSRLATEFDKGHFDERVATDTPVLPRAKRPSQLIGGAARDVQEAMVRVGPSLGDRCLDEGTDIEDLVIEGQVDEATAPAPCYLHVRI
jgi:hypothetical protein